MASSATEPKLLRPSDSAISEFQTEVARTFFSLPESERFLLAGAGSLIANGIVKRITEDLDFFTTSPDVSKTVKAFEIACLNQNWGFWIDPDRNYPTFVRAYVTLAGMDKDDALKVEFATDSPPLKASVVTFLGPTLGIEDGAGCKVLALFGRAEPRDFVDVYALSKIFSKTELLNLAAERDGGFDYAIFAQMLSFIDAIPNDQLEVSESEAADIRDFFVTWRQDLSRNQVIDAGG